MNKNKSFVFLSLLLIGSVSQLLIFTDYYNDSNDKDSKHLQSRFTYINSSPILIDNNFSASASFYGWTGNGSVDNPYMIENLNITSTSTIDCLTITNTNDYFIIKDSVFSGGHYGIFLSQADNGKIINNTISNNAIYGIYSIQSDYSQIIANNISGNQYGIFFQQVTTPAIINDNRIYDQSLFGVITTFSFDLLFINNSFFDNDLGIKVSNGNNITIYNNSFIDNLKYGVQFVDSTNSRIEENYLTGSVTGGIYGNAISIENSDFIFTYKNTIYDNKRGINNFNSPDNHFENNNITLTSEEGVKIDGSQNTTFFNNSFSLNNLEAIRSSTSPQSNFVENTISSTSDDAIYVVSSVGVNASGNTISLNSGMGIWFLSSSGEVGNNVIQNNLARGVYLSNAASNVNVHNNNIENNQYGIYVHSSSGNSFLSNNISDNSLNGFYIYNSGNSIVQDNTIENSSSYDLYLQNSGNNTITNNNFNVNGLGIYSSSNIQHYYQYNFANNFVDGKSIVYLMEDSNSEISDAGQLFIINSSSITINHLEISSLMPILIGFSTNITIDNATITNFNLAGIDIRYSHNVTILDTLITNGTNSGVKFTDSHNATIINNNLQSIEMTNSNFALISNNNISNQINYGIDIDNALNSTIRDNNLNSSRIALFNSQFSFISNNSVIEDGITVFQSTENNIFNNSLTWSSPSVGNTFHIKNSGNNIIKDNLLINGSFNIEGSTTPHLIQKLFDNNFLNNREVLYVQNTSGLVVTENFSQAFIMNSSNIHLTNQKYESIYTGVTVYYSSYITIDNNNFTNMYRNGIYFSWSDHSIIQNNYFNTIGYAGASILDTTNTTFSNNILLNNDFGLDIQATTNTTVVSNTISFSNQGIFCGNNQYLLIKNNYVSNSNLRSVYVGTSNYAEVINNTISFGSNNNLDLFWSNNVRVINNTIFGAILAGIFIERSDYGYFENNTISGNNVGFNVSISDYQTIIKNSINSNIQYGFYYSQSIRNTMNYNLIKENGNYGIYFDSTSGDSEVLVNDFVDNNGGSKQAYAAGVNFIAFNYWNDWVIQDVDLDNNNILDHPYVLDGSGLVKDSYPQTNRVSGIESPVIPVGFDFTYTIYTQAKIDDSIIWTAFSPNASYYQLFQNNSLIQSNNWVSGQGISIFIGDFDPETYNLTIVFVDSYGNEIADSIIFTVEDGQLYEITTLVTYTTIVTSSEVISTETTTETVASSGFTIGIIIFTIVILGLLIHKRKIS